MTRHALLTGMLALCLIPAVPLASAGGGPCDQVPIVRDRVDCANATQGISVDVATRDQYGAFCFGAYKDQRDEAHQLFGLCAGKGIWNSADPDDCTVYVYLYGGAKWCQPVPLPLP